MKKKNHNLSKLDSHGQPVLRTVSTHRLTHRTVDELIGVCKGIVADGVLHDDEIKYLANWLEWSRDIIEVWPASVLAERVKRMLSNGVIDEVEKNELFNLLQEIVGCKTADELIDKRTGEVIENISHLSTSLPLDKPTPTIVFAGKHFCFTGRFLYGSRTRCETEVLKRGGLIQNMPSGMTDYLIIGLLGSTDWKHSTYGAKIQKAVDLKGAAGKIAIISEEQWEKSLNIVA